MNETVQDSVTVSRRDSHYSSQRTIVSQSNSQSRRQSSSVEDNSYHYHTTRFTSRPDSIRRFDSEDFSLKDDHEMMNKNIHRASFNSSFSYQTSSKSRHAVNCYGHARRPNTSERMTTAPLFEHREAHINRHTSSSSRRNNNHHCKSRDLPGTSNTNWSWGEAFAASQPETDAKTDLACDVPTDNLTVNGSMILGRVTSDHGKKQNRKFNDSSVALQLRNLPHLSIAGSSPHSSVNFMTSFGEKALTPSKDGELDPHPVINSRFLDKLSTLGLLVLFSLLGTLARISLEKLTYYPGAPVSTSILWANLTGCLLIGFLTSNNQLFSITADKNKKHETTASHNDYTGQSHTRAADPFYIGLTVGFCGSLTSFSSLIHDAFLALSNGLPALGSGEEALQYDELRFITSSSRSAIYSLLSVLAILIMNAVVSFCAFKVGKHMTKGLAFLTPRLTCSLAWNKSRKRTVLSTIIILSSFMSWFIVITFTALSSALVIPSTTRMTFLFPLATAPPGCLLRYVLTRLNRSFNIRHLYKRDQRSVVSNRWQRYRSSVPIGTLAANLSGTIIFALVWDLQHGLGMSLQISPISCQALAGILDGFCGSLTTVSTLVAEVVAIASFEQWKNERRKTAMQGPRNSVGGAFSNVRRRVGLRKGIRKRVQDRWRRKGSVYTYAHAYAYGIGSGATALALAVLIMGSVRWSAIWIESACPSYEP